MDGFIIFIIVAVFFIVRYIRRAGTDREQIEKFLQSRQSVLQDIRHNYAKQTKLSDKRQRTYDVRYTTPSRETVQAICVVGPGSRVQCTEARVIGRAQGIRVDTTIPDAGPSAMPVPPSPNAIPAQLVEDMQKHTRESQQLMQQLNDEIAQLKQEVKRMQERDVDLQTENSRLRRDLAASTSANQPIFR